MKNKKRLLFFIGIAGIVFFVFCSLIVLMFIKKRFIRVDESNAYEPDSEVDSIIPFDGYLIESKTEFGKGGVVSGYTEFKYDSYGRCISEILYSQKGGQIIKKTSYEIDYSKGGVPVKAVIDEKGVTGDKTVFSYEYDLNGKLTKESYYIGDELKGVAEYDDLGRTVRETLYEDGKETDSFEYNYDVNGIVCSKKGRDASGDSKVLIEAELDSYGRVTTVVDNPDSSFVVSEYEYDESGRIKRIVMNSDDVVNERQYSYNTSGLVELIEFKQNEETIGVYSYSYNENGDRTSFYSKAADGSIIYGYEATYKRLDNIL